MLRRRTAMLVPVLLLAACGSAPVLVERARQETGLVLCGAEAPPCPG